MIKDMVKEVRSKSNESSSRKQSMRFTESEPSRKELEEVWSEAAPGLEGGLAGAWGGRCGRRRGGDRGLAGTVMTRLGSGCPSVSSLPVWMHHDCSLCFFLDWLRFYFNVFYGTRSFWCLRSFFPLFFLKAS